MLAVLRCRAAAGDCPARRLGDERGEIHVKKLLAALALAAVGFAVWRKLEADKAEQALWAEVTDPVK